MAAHYAESFIQSTTSRSCNNHTIKHLDYDEYIRHAIDVSKPYYALSDEHEIIAARTGTNVGFLCTVQAEMPLGRECGDMGMGEAGRHMAIAGSVAAALQNPTRGKFYYLVLHAEVTHVPYEGTAGDLFSTSCIDTRGRSAVHCRCTEITQRIAHCVVRLETSESLPAWQLKVKYAVIPERVFKTKYPPTGLGVAAGMESPYSQFNGLPQPPAKLSSSTSEEVHMEARMPPCEAWQCVGHFEGNPAFPVAFLCSYVSDLVGQSIANLTGVEMPFKKCAAEEPLAASWQLTSWDLKVQKLVFAGSHGLSMTCKTRLLEGSLSTNGSLYDCEVTITSDDSRMEHIATLRGSSRLMIPGSAAEEQQHLKAACGQCHSDVPFLLKSRL